MSIDAKNIGAGDRVAIAAVIYDDENSDAELLFFRTKFGAQGYVTPDEIVSHTPRGLVAGDRVEHRETGGEGKIVAAHKGLVWVEYDLDCGTWTHDADEWRRVA
jgi:hypothetical protein